MKLNLTTEEERALRQHIYGHVPDSIDKDALARACDKLWPPECNCGVAEGEMAHTAHEFNRGGHAVSCPRRDYAHENEPIFPAERFEGEVERCKRLGITPPFS